MWSPSTDTSTSSSHREYLSSAVKPERQGGTSSDMHQETAHHHHGNGSQVAMAIDENVTIKEEMTDFEDFGMCRGLHVGEIPHACAMCMLCVQFGMVVEFSGVPFAGVDFMDFETGESVSVKSEDVEHDTPKPSLQRETVCEKEYHSEGLVASPLLLVWAPCLTPCAMHCLCTVEPTQLFVKSLFAQSTYQSPPAYRYHAVMFLVRMFKKGKKGKK